MAAIVFFVWGSAIVLYGVFGAHGSTGSAYGSGQLLGWAFGLAMAGFGGRQLWFEFRARR